ncbi:hypothetical protein CXF47_04835 [Corynebacterium bovis]|nr:hypothetical protein CXF47_04835 [Corynebacterium bovis]
MHRPMGMPSVPWKTVEHEPPGTDHFTAWPWPGPDHGTLSEEFMSRCMREVPRGGVAGVAGAGLPAGAPAGSAGAGAPAGSAAAGAPAAGTGAGAGLACAPASGAEPAMTPTAAIVARVARRRRVTRGARSPVRRGWGGRRSLVLVSMTGECIPSVRFL